MRPFSKSNERSLNQGPVYAALDLGTNNCRLLIARQAPPDSNPSGFRIVDSFCRIVRLGEGISQSGRLTANAMDRAIAALEICREKIQARHVSRSRLIATEACRAAENSGEFLQRVYDQTRLELEIVDRETEAFLATAGCASLADPAAEGIVLFDIGGGSSEIVWLDRDVGTWSVARPHPRMAFDEGRCGPIGRAFRRQVRDARHLRRDG